MLEVINKETIQEVTSLKELSDVFKELQKVSKNGKTKRDKDNAAKLIKEVEARKEILLKEAEEAKKAAQYKVNDEILTDEGLFRIVAISEKQICLEDITTINGKPTKLNGTFYAVQPTDKTKTKLINAYNVKEVWQII